MNKIIPKKLKTQQINNFKIDINHINYTKKKDFYNNLIYYNNFI